jgi:hypothetical protein
MVAFRSAILQVARDDRTVDGESIAGRKRAQRAQRCGVRST